MMIWIFWAYAVIVVLALACAGALVRCWKLEALLDEERELHQAARENTWRGYRLAGYWWGRWRKTQQPFRHGSGCKFSSCEPDDFANEIERNIKSLEGVKPTTFEDFPTGGER